MICRQCVVSGQVQGVFFRASTQAEAERLGVKGWVRNEPDGTVRLLVCGEPVAVDQLSVWLHTGPRYAQVTCVSCADQPFEAWADFRVV